MPKILLLGLLFALPVQGLTSSVGWKQYGGPQAQKYSDLSQINLSNVAQVQETWTFSTNEAGLVNERPNVVNFENTPLVVGSRMFICSSRGIVFALNAKTGEKIWKYDPEIPDEKRNFSICRGLSYWKNPSPTTQSCSERIITATLDGRLISLDAKSTTPKVCDGFGQNGSVDLRKDLGSDQQANEVNYTSPPLIYSDDSKNLIVVGGSVADNRRIAPPSGVIRAFDADSGRLIWAFDPAPDSIPRPENQELHGKYVRGTPNSWTLLTADTENNLIFVPMGNASPDYFFGNRHRSEITKYSSSLVALNATTGKVEWYFKTVLNDVFDYDLPSQPILAKIPVFGFEREVVIQSTKAGMIFVLDRHTGQPVFPIEMKSVPTNGGLPGEVLSPVQPYTTFPKPIDISHLTKLDDEHLEHIRQTLNGNSEDGTLGDKKVLECKKMWSRVPNQGDGRFSPPSLEGSLVAPGYYGGFNWGGCSLDPNSYQLTCNVLQSPSYLKIHREESEYCQALSSEYNQMRGTGFCAEIKSTKLGGGLSCHAGPQGETISYNLGTYMGIPASGIKWQKPLANGSLTMGGVLSTAGHLIFTGSYSDKKFRALASETGEVLKEWELSAGGTAAPMTYMVDGEQYIAIAAGGHPIYAGSLDDFGDTLHVFKLTRP